MEWRQVKGWPYQVSSTGQVRRADTLDVVTPKSQGRYLQVYIKDGTRQAWPLVSRLVYETFIGPIPEGHIIHHKDGNKLNNRLENLQCVSRQEHFGLHGCGSLTDQQVIRVCELLRDGKLLHREIAEMFGVSRPLISNIATGRKRRSGAWERPITTPRVKLTDDDVAQVRELLHWGGLKHGEIAELFGVSRPLISLIASGKKRGGATWSQTKTAL
jgi:predicted XRE-type DNA-binding protein